MEPVCTGTQQSGTQVHRQADRHSSARCHTLTTTRRSIGFTGIPGQGEWGPEAQWHSDKNHSVAATLTIWFHRELETRFEYLVQVHPQDLKEEANHHFATMVGCNTDQIPLRFPEIGDVLLCIVDKTFALFSEVLLLLLLLCRTNCLCHI